MVRGIVRPLVSYLCSPSQPLAAAACSAANGKTRMNPRGHPWRSFRSRPPTPSSSRSRVSSAATGTLMAEEQADVAAETAGRVVAAPIERGTPVTQDAALVIRSVD